MSGERFRLRVSASTREFEIEGSEKFVEKYWAELKPLLSDARSADAPQPTVPPNQAPDSIQQVNSELPDSFGQYFSMFQNPNQVAQALIAGYYYQEKVDGDSSFTTAGINELLIEQSVKLTNTSDCIRKNRDAKRLFNKSRGNFCVSRIGQEYIQELLSQSNDND